MNLHLYQIADQYLGALRLLEDMPLDAESAAALDMMTGAIQIKGAAVAAFALNLEAEARAIKEAEGNMAARRKSIESRAAWLRAYLLSNMEKTGTKEIIAPDHCFAVRVRINPPSVALDDDLTALPAEYWRVVPETREPDKASIKSDLLEGVVIPGAHLSRASRLEIK